MVSFFPGLLVLVPKERNRKVKIPVGCFFREQEIQVGFSILEEYLCISISHAGCALLGRMPHSAVSLGKDGASYKYVVVKRH